MIGEIVLGTAVALAVDEDGPLFGVLLTGPSGIGKTSLALSLAERCAWRRTALIADDAVIAERTAARLRLRAPDTTRGLSEVRGTGLLRVAAARGAALGAVFDLVAAPTPRLPAPSVFVRPGAAPVPRHRWDRGRGASGLVSVCRAAVSGHSPGERAVDPGEAEGCP